MKILQPCTVAFLLAGAFLTWMPHASAFRYWFCNKSDQDIRVTVTPGGGYGCANERPKQLSIRAHSWDELHWTYLTCNIKDGVLEVNGKKVNSYKVEPGHRLIGRRGDAIHITREDRVNADGSVTPLWNAHETELGIFKAC